jgi:uncharacterized membrane protein (UPF0127 family)
MAKLMRGTEILASVEFAHNPLRRAIGLLGRASLPIDQVMWLKPGNNIHTMFMRFAIDVIFVDKNLVVRKIHRQVKPGKLWLASWKANSTFECAAGFLDQHRIQEGDQLHVGS